MPIGIFDSGLGGLTVAREIARVLPGESLVYLGDTARCPYGPREPDEVRRFVLQIGSWLEQRPVKLIVVACNTATAAGLALAQKAFAVPVVGVIEPGARAAVMATVNRRVGVIGTVGTIESGAYSQRGARARRRRHGLLGGDASARRHRRGGAAARPGADGGAARGLGRRVRAAVVPPDRARLPRPAQAQRHRHARAGLHALSAAGGSDPAGGRAARLAHLVGRGDRLRGRRDAGAPRPPCRPGSTRRLRLRDHRRRR